MRTEIAEYNCFISIEHSKNLQLVNHSGVNNYAQCNVLSSSYKHKVPEIQMNVEFPHLAHFCKPGFENTNTKIKTHIDESASKQNNFVIYFNGSEAHFVPIARPVLKSYVCNVKETEFKKTAKRDFNITAESKSNLEDFSHSCPGGLFEPISALEKIRQVFVPAEYESYHGDSGESKRRILLCYGRQKLDDFESADDNLIEKVKSMKETKTKNESIVFYKKSDNSLPLETEIMNILIKYKLVKFNNLIDLLRDRQKLLCGDISERRVLHYLPTVALMVRGYWVIKSEVLYIMSSGVHTLSADIMVPVRDYVMCLFHEGIETTTKKIQSITKIPSMEATEILEQFASRVTDPNTGKSQWKFKESNFEFILKHHEINTEQSRIMDEKKVEVCRAFKLQTLLGDACSSKPHRQRSMSSQIEFSDGNSNACKRIARFNDFSPPLMNHKRQRLNSTPLECSEIDYQSFKSIIEAQYQGDIEHMATVLELDPKSLEVAPVVGADLEPHVEEIITMMEHLKEEPVLSPKKTNDECTIQEQDNFSYCKTELNEMGHVDKELERDSEMMTECFPSPKIYNDMTRFIRGQFNDHLIIPVNDWASVYQQDYLSKIPISDYEKWRNLSSRDLNLEIERCICSILDEHDATKIDIEWPQISNSLSKQILYLSVNKSIDDDQKFIGKLLEMLKATGSVTMSDLKKALSSDNDMKQIMPYTANILRDKVQRYCLYRHRKFFLKYTVS